MNFRTNQTADATQRLVAPTMLYRFSVDCLPTSDSWNRQTGIALDDSFRLPVFGELDDRPAFADVRVAWSDKGLFVTVDVAGKQQSPWCRHTQLLESDGMQLWIDTRDTHNIHRASRFCHWFVCLPTGGGARRDSALASMLKINRARDVPKTFGQSTPEICALLRHDGYHLSVHIPGKALDGWDIQEYRKLGFSYAVIDRELGWQTFATGPEFPIFEDPGLWQTLELVG